jgi:hypothetical protein
MFRLPQRLRGCYFKNWPKLAGMVKEAGGFANVSNQAMIIRLQDLGLVRNETRAHLSWVELFSFS